MKTRRPFTFALLSLFMAGCTTDLEVNAPYKNVTIIYGLLSTKTVDATDETVHLVKINKAFLGEGDAFVYALIPDSNEYNDDQLEVAQVERWTNGVLAATYPLNDTLIDGRVPGTFNYPVHKLYYFMGALDPASQYKVVCQVKGETVSALTSVVNDFTVNNSDQNVNVAMNFMAASGYGVFELNWSSGPNGKRYDTHYRFRFAEIRGADTTYKSFTRLMGSRVTTNTTGGESLSSTANGEAFYKAIAENVTPDPTITKRLFLGIDLLFAVASEDFHTYLQLANPLTGIVEERPDFTNVTNGYGLFASRYFKTITGKKLSDVSLNELLNGTYTAGQFWCSVFNSGPPYGCN